mgnify:CR=1 FL=1
MPLITLVCSSSEDSSVYTPRISTLSSSPASSVFHSHADSSVLCCEDHISTFHHPYQSLSLSLCPSLHLSAFHQRLNCFFSCAQFLTFAATHDPHHLVVSSSVGEDGPSDRSQSPQPTVFHNLTPSTAHLMSVRNVAVRQQIVHDALSPRPWILTPSILVVFFLLVWYGPGGWMGVAPRG